MRTGQILAAIGALLTLIAVLALPMFEIPQQNPAMAMEVSAGLWLVIISVLVLALAAAGHFLRKVRLFGAINVVLAGFLVGLAIYLGMNAPFLFQAAHQLPFDTEVTPAKFIGFMTGGLGLYILWIGALTTLFGCLLISISQPRYSEKARFLRLALLWRDDLVKECVVEDFRDVTLGEGVKNDIIVSGAPETHTLFKFLGGKSNAYALRLAQDFEGRLHLGGKTAPASDSAGKDTDLKDGDWGVLRFGENSLFFQMIKPSNLVGNKFFGDFDVSYSSAILLSLVVQAGFLVYVAIAPMDVNYASRSKDAFTKLIKIETRHLDAEKEKKKKEEEELERLKKEEVKKEEEKLPEEVPEEQPPMPDKPIEKAGDPLKKDIDLTDLKKRNQLKPMKDDHKGLDAKRDQLALDKKQGMVAVLKNKSRKKSALSSVLGKQKNLIAKNAVWGEDGDFVLENEGQSDLSYEGGSLTTGDYGGGGLGGAGGFGDGGGGGGFGGGGAFGMGGMGGVGGLGGIGGADASRAGRMALAGLKDKGRARASRVSMGTGGVSGFCKKQDVLKTVQRRAAAIRSCYEVALQLNPDLKGKIVVKWTINLDGKVEGVQTVSNNLNNKKVEECMAKVIGHMRFKRPSGGICIIKWPFVFSSASGEE